LKKSETTATWPDMSQNGLTDRDNVPPLPPSSRIHFHPFRRGLKPSPPQHRSSSSNPSSAPDYSWEITQNLLKAESSCQLPAHYLSTQSDINPLTRAVLVDFLIDLHRKLNLTPETLYLAIGLFDRVLAVEKVGRAKVQLLGVSALMVASKYEEVTIPQVSQYLEAMDGAYGKEDILGMERSILKAVGFGVSVPTAFTFYSRVESLVVEDQVTMALGMYIMELSLMEYPALDYRASLLTSSAYYLAKRLRSRPSPWPPVLQRQFGYSETDLKPCLRLLYPVYISAEKSVLQAARKKYASAAFFEVSKLRL